MQPLTARRSGVMGPAGKRKRGTTAAEEQAMTRAERGALEFFASALPAMPPYHFQVARYDERPVLIWTDGASEPTSERPHTIGFVVAVPRAGSPGVGSGLAGLAALQTYYDIYHSSAELPRAFMDCFKPRAQQIGQVELVGALVPYLSLPMLLRGRRVLHWIDNSSAVAAAVKGYSYAADSARIVHGLHASLLALGVRAWFEYVRTDANVSDKPSREDLSTACYALGEVMGEAITGRLDSVPVGSVLPDVSDWRDPAAAWIGF